MTKQLTPEEQAAIDRAAGTLDRFMDQLDEIANPGLFRELKETRLELATREAELKESHEIIEARQSEIHDLQARLGHALQDVSRFEAAWNQAMTELGDLKRRNDQFMKVFDNMVDLGATLGRINSELDQMRMAMFKALTAAMSVAPGSTQPPDLASPEPASVATAPTTVTGEVDEEHFWARPMSDVAYLDARKLYDAGDIAGAQMIILEDLIAWSRRAGKASPTTAGDAIEADPTTETGESAGDVA